VNFPFPVLVCDIGGTNVRLSVLAGPDAALGPVSYAKTHDHASFEAAIAAQWPVLLPQPRSFILCAAGPASARKLKLTNAPWTIDADALLARFGFEQGLILNDFEAQALSLPALAPAEWRTIGTFIERPGMQVILGSGTGLGVAALVERGGRHLALSSEAGHMDFGPATAEEESLWPYIEKAPLGRVSAEMLLSGPGLVRLHQARLRSIGAKDEALEAQEIDARAHADRVSQEAQTIRLFLQLLARFAGDLALAFLAHGGVSFAGGILPKLAEFLDPARFRAAFEAKAPHESLMREIGTRLITDEAAVLAGMAALARNPDRYIIDYAERAWR
jgi:glucokinase